MTTVRDRLPTGIDGLDEVLGGGVLGERAYMVGGGAGTGKTVLCYHFLTADPDADALYIGFEETAADVRANAAAVGIDLEGVRVLDLSPDDSLFRSDAQYTVFAPDEVEATGVFDRLVEAFDDGVPDRLVVDPLSQLRRLSVDDHQFHQRVASLFTFLRRRGCTTLFTTQPTGASESDLEFLADGAISLRREDRYRTIEVTKLRGSGFASGTHALRITDTGLRVFPTLIPGEHDATYERDQLSSGVAELDTLLGGGLERGTVTVVSGPSGVGKSTTGANVLVEAALGGVRAAAYLFEESVESFTERASATGLPIEAVLESGHLELEAVEPLVLSADEFANQIRAEVEANGTEVVLIDGVAGYRLSLHHGHADLVTRLHALCRYLRNVGVTVLLTEEIRGITGGFAATDAEISYIADNILFLRYVELDGEIRKTVGVLKKRLGPFEPTLRELRITRDGLTVGDPLDGLRGVLTGTPEWND